MVRPDPTILPISPYDYPAKDPRQVGTKVRTRLPLFKLSPKRAVEVKLSVTDIVRRVPNETGE